MYFEGFNEYERNKLLAEAEAMRKEEEEKNKVYDLLEQFTTNFRPYYFICENCGKIEFLYASDAFRLGWDYPRRPAEFRVISPRVCPDCSISDTLWWRMSVEGKSVEELSEHDLKTLQRINSEPYSLL